MLNERVERVRYVGTALALILAPLLYMIGQALQPDIDTSSAAEQLPVLIEHNNQGVSAILICILGLILFIPAVLGLMRLLHGTGAWLGLVGGSLSIAGLVLFTSLLTAVGLVPFDLADVSESERAGVQTSLQALIDSANGQGAVGAYVGIGFAILPLGLLLIAIGLWRARTVARWMAIVIAIGALGLVAGADHWIRALDAAILMVGMGAVGVQMLREPQSAVAHVRATSVGGVHPAHPSTG